MDGMNRGGLGEEGGYKHTSPLTRKFSLVPGRNFLVPGRNFLVPASSRKLTRKFSDREPAFFFTTFIGPLPGSFVLVPGSFFLVPGSYVLAGPPPGSLFLVPGR